ncbi:MAG: flagellar hook-associated protein FlgK [Bryobacteraceae bacterium]
MASILSTLVSAASALDAFGQALDVTQNNVSNSQTPGYANQTQILTAMPFDPADGSTGGVSAAEVVSSRDQYAEQAVRQQNVLLGQAQQNVTSFTSLQSLFDISGNSGIPYALNNLFTSFSAWGQTPTDTDAQQAVINSATDLANAFQQTATGMAQAAQNNGSQIDQTVVQINQLAGQLAGFNSRAMCDATPDAGLDAQINSTLEQLSQYVNFTASQQPDGAVTVLVNGQVPLVMGANSYALQDQPVAADPSSANPNAPPKMSILSSDGKDITSQVTSGQLGALVNLANNVFPQYLGDGNNAGDLNTMAKQFADCVNQLLTQGNISDGPPPVAGVPLFTYDTTDATNVAQTLAVDPTVSAGQLAAISPGPPEVSNGVPLALSALADPQSSADEINGASYSDFYGNMAAAIGNDLNDATNNQQVQQSALAQAQNLRQQVSGVSLDAEAAALLQFQQAYEANSKLITVLDQLSEDTINMLIVTT